ncbi:MAG: hypothetical protein IT373_16625 [Polyangiaceae bacterium]|nr:hypothetical protein [Polyangiaceae bacterium]
MPRHNEFRAILFSTLLPLAPAHLLGCAGSQAGHGSEDLRPVDEARAVAVIDEALTAQHLTVAPGADVASPDGDVHVELWVEQGYGIAYVTELEDQKSGGKLPKAKGRVLPLLRVEGDRTVLVLYDRDYQYDAGKTHSSTALTAELKLKRDVTDFALQVVKK